MTNENEIIYDMKKRLSDVLNIISWREVAYYFSKSPSWVYHKLDGIDGNGGKGGFNPEEREKLRGILFELSDRIRKAAERI